MADSFKRINKGLIFRPQTSTPTNPTNGDFYYDDTLTKFRAYENGSWVNVIGGASGSVGLNDGTQAAPSLYFTSDSDVGIYRAAADTLAIVANNTELAKFSTSLCNINTDVFISDGTPELRLTSTNSNSSSYITVLVNTAATTADPYAVFSGTSNTNPWAIGRDTSDSNVFKLSQSSSLGTNDYLRVTTSGAFSIGPSAAAVTHTLYGDLFIQDGSAEFRATGTSTDSAAFITLRQQATATTADVYVLFSDTGGTNSWAAGRDRSDSNKFKICQSGSLGTNDYFTIGTAGAVTLGASGSTSTHNVNGPLKVNDGLSLASVRTVTTTASVNADDCVVLCNPSTGFTLTLPNTSDGRVLLIKDISNTASSNNITLARSGSDLIDGSTSFVINQNRQAVMLVGITGGWAIM